MTGNEVRKKYIAYFKKKNHTIIRSSSLIPSHDPTLLFTNAGMVQFKRIFLGEEKKYYNKAVTAQKCVRAGGKHNDLENVGYTSRHHTFFEMLGNFSFGNYFKNKSIEYSWDLISNIYKLPTDKIWISVHNDDNESYKIWEKNIGIPSDRIVTLGNEENFWSMGDTGPCGPCSELHIDRGQQFGCGKPECGVNCNCDRFCEIWNLVFMQFNRDKFGNITPLPEPSIDTGLGLERMTSILQNVETTFETDLILPIINKSEDLSGLKFGESKENDIAMKIIADHSRAASFLISDGVIPSNEGRGYVLRRIIRRAIRYGRNLNLNKPFLCETAKIVFGIMEEAYPELKKSAPYISNVINNEEIRFSETIDNGLKILNENLENIILKGNKIIPGDLIFKLHDTYGFPIDIVRDVAKSKNMTIDSDGFHNRMNKQRKKSNSKKIFKNISTAYKKLSKKRFKSKFIGYKFLKAEAKIILLIENGIEVKQSKKGSIVEIITDVSPLYAESGGQVGDQGKIEAENLTISIKNTFKNPSGIIIHKGQILSGLARTGQKVFISVDKDNRRKISNNHTTTHILQAALRKVIGKSVKQCGSLVSSKKLRFDFTYLSKISREILDKIEEEVNKQICKNTLITTIELPIETALKSGAIALFEEKYEDKVRVVSIDPYSKELCGGTHVIRTGEIGMFKIISEYGIASGVRRIEALTGNFALEYTQNMYAIINNISIQLKTSQDNILQKTIDIKTSNKSFKKRIDRLTTENAILKIKTPSNNLNNLSHPSNKLLESTIINGIKIKTEIVELNTANALRKMTDQLKNEIKSGIIALGCKQKNKALLIVGITKDLTNKFNASKMINEMAELIGGKGGGRPDMAQAGGPRTNKLDQALEKIKELVRNT